MNLDESGGKPDSFLRAHSKTQGSRIAVFLAQSMVSVHKWWAPWRRMILISVFGFCSECKHRPTCSEYFLEQTEKYGWRGLWRGLKRLLACH